MKKAYKLIILLTWVSTLGVSFAGDDITSVVRRPVEQDRLVDGVYEGSHKAGLNEALVRVTIKDKKIVKIEIIKHRA